MSEDERKCKSPSRRSFLKRTGGAAIIAGMAAGGVTLSQEAQAARGAMPKKWDETYDVVVVGSGFAGLSAAIEAKNAGASVTVIEKMPVHGGNSIINGGAFSAADTKMQAEAGGDYIDVNAGTFVGQEAEHLK